MELIRVYHTKRGRFGVYESCSSSGINYVKYIVVGRGKMAVTKTEKAIPTEELEDRIIKPLIAYIESEIGGQEIDSR